MANAGCGAMKNGEPSRLCLASGIAPISPRRLRSHLLQSGGEKPPAKPAPTAVRQSEIGLQTGRIIFAVAGCSCRLGDAFETGIVAGSNQQAPHPCERQMKSALLMFDNAAYADDLKALQKIKSADFEVTSIRPDQDDRLVSWINWVNKNTEGMSPYALSNEFVIISDTKKSETMIRKVKPLIQPRVYVASIRDENAYALFILDFFEKNDH